MCKSDASQEDFGVCSAEEKICPALKAGEFMEYKPDTAYEYYLDNWYTQMD